MDSYAIVIKVKFEETLRRFNAHVLDEVLDLDMARLREKIAGLFDFAPETDFILTYIDEDGDIVTLADDDDLSDVVRQSLNPLRITVKLKSEKAVRSSSRSSGSSTPMRSTEQHPLHHLNTSVSEVLKSVPEPLRDAVSKITADLAQRAASSGPGLAELVDIFSKMGMTYLNQVSDTQTVQKSSSPGGASGSTFEAYDMEGRQSSGVAHTRSYASVVALHPDPQIVGRNSEREEVPVQKETEVASSDVLRTGSVDLNVPPHASSSRPIDLNAPPPPPPPSYSCGVSPGKIMKEPPAGAEHKSGGFSAANPDYVKHRLEDSFGDCGNFWRKMPTDSGSSSGTYSGWAPSSECPFSGIPMANDSGFTPLPYMPPIPSMAHPFKRSYNHADGIGSIIFHRGVRCDGCGVHPITGPRFKSKVKEDYDLCSICFAGMGNEADYVRMDRPSVPRHPRFFKGTHDHAHMRTPSMPWRKPHQPKLDSRFILDVNILDGTIMAPSTPFTKIWRMRNNGSTVWPQGSQLCWIGGDKLSDTMSADVEIPAAGLPLDKEIDIAVDFMAPELPGRYCSYWRMASPSGQKFGQRVWVLIQVDASLKESVQTINLNLPPASTSVTEAGTETVNVKPEPSGEGTFPGSIGVTEFEDPFYDAQPPNKDQELNFPINDTLLVGDYAASNKFPARYASSVLYPTVDDQGMMSTPLVPPGVYVPVSVASAPPTFPSPASTPATMQPSASEEVHGNKEREQSLLKELEEMGFKQVDLNKEILRMNDFNLDLSLDDLCGIGEWDPILEELQEMGFSDKEMNKRLLKKNNGSIKRVVMDLINGEKD